MPTRARRVNQPPPTRLPILIDAREIRIHLVVLLSSPWEVAWPTESAPMACQLSSSQSSLAGAAGVPPLEALPLLAGTLRFNRPTRSAPLQKVRAVRPYGSRLAGLPDGSSEHGIDDLPQIVGRRIVVIAAWVAGGLPVTAVFNRREIGCSSQWRDWSTIETALPPANTDRPDNPRHHFAPACSGAM